MTDASCQRIRVLVHNGPLRSNELLPREMTQQLLWLETEDVHCIGNSLMQRRLIHVVVGSRRHSWSCAREDATTPFLSLSYCGFINYQNDNVDACEERQQWRRLLPL